MVPSKMGIKNLNKFIRERFPHCITNQPLTDLSFTRVAIDAPIFMYKFKSINAARMFEPDYKTYNWLWSFIYMVHQLREVDIHPVFVFEGKSPVEKKETQLERRRAREHLKETTKVLEESLSVYLEESGTVQVPVPDVLQRQWEKILRQNKIALDCPFDSSIVQSSIAGRQRYNIDISRKDYQILKVLLGILGTTAIQAPGEAETYCAYLESKGLISGVMSTDTDLLAYGCKKLIIKNDTSTYTYIDLTKLLDCMRFTQEEFLTFCIMCGTDYNNNIPGIGIQKAYKFCQNGTALRDIASQEFWKTYQTTETLFRTFNGLENSGQTPEAVFCRKVNIYLLTYFKYKFDLQFDPSTLNKGFNVSNVTILAECGDKIPDTAESTQ
jgi:5'-3' exonuclease